MNRRATVAAIGALLFLTAAALGLSQQDGSRETVYVLVTIDTERDLPPYYDTMTGMTEGIPALCGILESHGVTATFFVTGSVAGRAPDTIRTLSQTHEIGSHCMYHEEKLSTLTYEEKWERVAESAGILSSITGRKVTSFRAPYHSADTELYNILEDQGYLVEASAYAGPDAPYHPSADDWRVHGAMNILHVPVTHVPGIFYPYNTYPGTWPELADFAIESQKGQEKKLIVIGLHPWELCEQDFYPPLIGFERPCGNYTLTQLGSLLDHLDSMDAHYITMTEAYGLFT